MSNFFTLAAIAKRMETQDNLATQDPIYVVEQKRLEYGIDEEYHTDGYTWIDDDSSEPVDETKVIALLDRVWARDHEEPTGYSRRTYRAVWEFVTPCFTMEAAKLYISNNKHNLREPRVFVHSGYRNYEWQEVAKAIQTGTIDQHAKVLKTALEEVYTALLNHPDDSWRVENQELYCGLRDTLAFATGSDPRLVQEKFERLALDKARAEATTTKQEAQNARD